MGCALSQISLSIFCRFRFSQSPHRDENIRVLSPCASTAPSAPALSARARHMSSSAPRPLLVLGIISAPEYLERRLGVRHSWLQEPNVKSGRIRALSDQIYSFQEKLEDALSCYDHDEDGGEEAADDEAEGQETEAQVEAAAPPQTFESIATVAEPEVEERQEDDPHEEEPENEFEFGPSDMATF